MLFNQQLICKVYVIILSIVSLSLGTLANAIEINKPSNDQRAYYGMYLPNGLKVVLVSDPHAEKSAAVLSVNVGSFQDPSPREGLAHFLEHMLFLGTKKYPKPGEYGEYISSRGGYHNAMTSSEATTYLFSILPEHFAGGLDRFSQFFVSPLFNPELVDRERNAVDSEFKLKIKHDGRRVYQVHKVTSNTKHPFSQFSVGNLQTLENTDTNKVRDDLIEFYNNYYSADRMSLTLVSSHELSLLKEWANKYFSSIPKKKVLDVANTELVFTKEQTSVDIKIKPLGDYKELSFLFPIPSQRDNYLYKPAAYIAFLLEQSHSNSLYKHLKDKNLISNLSAQHDQLARNQDFIEVSFSLTEQGAKNIENISQYLFNYIEYLQANGIQEWIFEEMKKSGQRNLEYQEKISPLKYAMRINMNLAKYPIEKVLIAPYFYNKMVYNVDKIQEIFKYLVPTNARRILVDKNITTDKFEPLYKVEYSYEKLSKLQLTGWKLSSSKLAFSLLKPVSFMPENFAVNKNVKLNKLDPVLIVEQPGVRAWHKQDTEFLFPKQYINLVLANNIDSARSALKLQLWVNVIEDRLFEFATQFNLAGVNADISSISRGVSLEVAMFSDKADILFAKVSKHLKKATVDKNRFNIIKESLKRTLNNFYQQIPVQQGMSNIYSLLNTHAWHPMSLLSEIDSVTKDELEDYIGTFLQNMHLEWLVYGNISPTQAEDFIIPTSKAIINADFSEKPSVVGNSQMLLTPGTTNYYVFSAEHKDAVVISYYQANATGDHALAKTALIKEIINPPFYEELRTKQQLGYVVGAGVLPFRKQPSMMFYVESPNSSSLVLESKIETFIQAFKSQLESLTAKEFAVYQQGLVGKLLEKPHSMSEAMNRWWDKIIDETYHFKYNQDIAAELKIIEQEDLVSFYDELFLNPKIKRNLIVETIDENASFKNKNLITDINIFKGKAND